MTIFQELSVLSKSIVFTSINILKKTEILNQLSHILAEPEIEKARAEAQRLVCRLGTVIQIFLLYNRPYQDNPHGLMNYMRAYLEIKVRDGKDVPKNLGEIREFCNSRTLTTQHITEKLRTFISEYFDLEAFYNNVTKKNGELYNQFRQLSISLVAMEKSLRTSLPCNRDDLSSSNDMLLSTEAPPHILQMQETIHSVQFYRKVEKSLKHLQAALGKAFKTKLDFTEYLDKIMIISETPAIAATKTNLLLGIQLKPTSIVFHGKDTHRNVKDLESYFDMKSLSNLKSLRSIELVYEETDDIAEVVAAKKKIIANFNKEYKAALQGLGEFFLERLVRNLRVMNPSTLQTLGSALPVVRDDKDEAADVYLEEFVVVDRNLKIEELTIPEKLKITLINNHEFKFSNNLMIHLPLFRLECFLTQVLPQWLASTPTHLKIKAHMLSEIKALDIETQQVSESISKFQTDITGNKYAYEQNIKFLETISALQAVQTHSKQLFVEISQADEKDIKNLHALEEKLALHKKSIKLLTDSFQTCRDKDYPQIIASGDALKTRYTALAENLAQLSESIQKLKTEYSALPNDSRNNVKPLQTCSENIANVEKLLKSANETYSQLTCSSDSNAFRKIFVTLDLLDSYSKKISSVLPLITTFIIEDKQRIENAQIGKQKKFATQTNQRFFSGATGAGPAQPAPSTALRRSQNPHN